MPDRLAQAPWLEWVLQVLYQSQWQLLQWLHQLGLVGEQDGQPAWPLRWRLSGEHLLLDVGQARALLISVAVVVALLLGALCAWRWPRLRGLWWAALLLAVWFTPWPAAKVLVVPAHPASFHTPAVPWSDHAISAGAQHYAQHCVQCHGVRGTGQGPLAAQQSVWPPNFASPLLWRRADGDLFAHVRYGMRDRQGAITMPGFGEQLSVDATWQVLHYLRALAAGQVLQATGEWAQAVPMPDMHLHCAAAHKRYVRDWQGQRLLWVTGAVDALQPDPRMVTVWLPDAEAEHASIPPQVDCVVTSLTDARLALATLTGQGAENIAASPQQLLADRQGWLRARNDAKSSAWSESSLICSTPTQASSLVTTQPAEDGLGRLLRLMDNTPVRFVKGGRVH